MRVQFTYSQEDLVDASLRFAARSKSLRLMRRKRTAWLAFLAWLLVFILTRYSVKGFISGMVAALIVVITDPWTYKYELRKNLRKVAKERYGEENELVCELNCCRRGSRQVAKQVAKTFRASPGGEQLTR